MSFTATSYLVIFFQIFHRHGDGWMYNNHMKHLVKPSDEENSAAESADVTDR